MISFFVLLMIVMFRVIFSPRTLSGSFSLAVSFTSSAVEVAHPWKRFTGRVNINNVNNTCLILYPIHAALAQSDDGHAAARRGSGHYQGAAVARPPPHHHHADLRQAPQVNVGECLARRADLTTPLPSSFHLSIINFI